jgi:hypothetical protein
MPWCGIQTVGTVAGKAHLLKRTPLTRLRVGFRFSCRHFAPNLSRGRSGAINSCHSKHVPSHPHSTLPELCLISVPECIADGASFVCRLRNRQPKARNVKADQLIRSIALTDSCTVRLRPALTNPSRE